jgi:hypothetical protein
MKSNLVNSIISSRVVLDEPMRPDIPDFDGVVFTTTGDAGAVGVETDGVDAHVMVLEGVDHGLGGHIEELDGVIGGT